MNQKILIIASILVVAISEIKAAPGHDHGHKERDGEGHGHDHHKHDHHLMKLDLTSCLTPETIQTIHLTKEQCHAEIAAISTTTTVEPVEPQPQAEEEPKNHHKGHCQQKKACFIKKFNQILSDAKSASESSAVTALNLLVINNFTAEAQDPFLNATNNCISTKGVKLDELIQKGVTEENVEDWKPAMECFRMGMIKACKPRACGSTTASSMNTQELPSTTEGDGTLEVETEN